MSLVDRLAGALGYERRIGLNNETSGPADRSVSRPWLTAAGTPVNVRLVENLSAVLACINAVASVAASLPAYCYRTVPGGREEDPGHPVARLIRRPNDWQTWPDWIEWTLAQVLRHGNALSAVQRDGAGRPIALIPLPYENVQPMLLANGSLAFDVVRYIGPWGGTGEPRRYLAAEVFHLKDRSDDGRLGRSRLSRAPEVLGNGLALQAFSSSMWRNQGTPSGVLRTDARLDDKQLQRMRASLDEAYAGPHNARKMMILEGGMQWQSIAASPEDAELLASRRFSVEEVCRLYQIPPPIVQDFSHGTFTNSREAGRWFAQFGLSPWARKIEAEFARSVFTGTSHHLEIDLSGLMRGDFAERWAAHKIAVDAKILDPDEIREAEGYNARGAQPAPAPVI